MATATATRSETKPLAEIVPIGSIKAKYRFESKPGVLRGLQCTIDWRPDWWLNPPKEPTKQTEAMVMLDSWDRRYTDDEKAILQQAYRELGGTTIRFNYERGAENQDGAAVTGHVWYATDSDAIAWVIRQHIEKAKHEMSDFRFVHEIARDEGQRLRVGDQVYATTEVGKRMAMEDSLASGEPIEPIAATG